MFAEGLCYAIEKNFNCGYWENSIPLALDFHIPAGCAEPEANMATYESFLADFNDNAEWLRDEYGYDDGDDEDDEDDEERK